MSLEKLTAVEKIRALQETIIGLLPESGQFPYILLRQARERLGDDTTWGDMQVAFNELYLEARVYPQQDFSQTITRRAYKL